MTDSTPATLVEPAASDTTTPGRPTIWQVARRLARELDNLIDREENRRDRAKLAALRRGLGKPGGWDPQLATVVNPHIGDLSQTHAEICYQVAALFGLHPVSWLQTDDDTRSDARSFGGSLHRYAVAKSAEGGSLDDIKKPLDRRVMALLDANSEDVYDHLRYAVSLLRGSEITVDWERLMKDLANWDHPSRIVQRTWARAWWPAPLWATSASTAESEPSNE